MMKIMEMKYRILKIITPLPGLTIWVPGGMILFIILCTEHCNERVAQRSNLFRLDRPARFFSVKCKFVVSLGQASKYNTAFLKHIQGAITSSEELVKYLSAILRPIALA